VEREKKLTSAPEINAIKKSISIKKNNPIKISVVKGKKLIVAACVILSVSKISHLIIKTANHRQNLRHQNRKSLFARLADDNRQVHCR